MNSEKNQKNISTIEDLKLLREQQDMSVESIAESLKVRKDFINYIESGEFDKLGAPTFIKGHVSNYCKVLGVDYESVIGLIPSHFLESAEIMPSDAIGATPLARVKSSSSHLGKYTVGTALLGMLALSFYFVWDKWSLSQLPAETSTKLNVKINDVQPDNLDSPKNQKMTYSSLLPHVQLKENNAVETASLDENPAVDDMDSTENEVTLNEPLDSQQTTDQVNADSVSTDQADESVKSMAAYTIQLQLDEQAWVSIKTQDGAKVVEDLIGPGIREYQSESPLQFRIGNATKTQLTINQTVVDMSPFMRRDIADFAWPQDPG